MMGCYGIGPARIVAAAIEQGADEKGIVWPPPLAPWPVHLSRSARRARRRSRPRSASTTSFARRGSSPSSTTATPARARSSPMPSCSAVRCGSSSASARWPRARSRRRSAASGADHRLHVGEVVARARELLDVAGLRADGPARSAACSGSTARARRRARRAAARRCTRGRCRTSSATCAWRRSRCS